MIIRFVLSNWKNKREGKKRENVRQKNQGKGKCEKKKRKEKKIHNWILLFAGSLVKGEFLTLFPSL